MAAAGRAGGGRETLTRASGSSKRRARSSSSPARRRKYHSAKRPLLRSRPGMRRSAAREASTWAGCFSCRGVCGERNQAPARAAQSAATCKARRRTAKSIAAATRMTAIPPTSGSTSPYKRVRDAMAPPRTRYRSAKAERSARRSIGGVEGGRAQEVPYGESQVALTSLWTELVQWRVRALTGGDVAGAVGEEGDGLALRLE